MKNNKIKCIGVDPAKNVIKNIKDKRITTYGKPFDLKLSKKIKSRFKKVDLIVSSFSFGHIDNMKSVVGGIDNLLDENGTFIFEIYYLGTVIKEFQYDMMYHEHMTYYTIKSLRKFLAKYNLRIFNIEQIKLRSGSLRFYCCRLNNKRVNSSNVKRFLDYENKSGFNKLSSLISYNKKISKTKVDLIKLLKKFKKEK